MIFGGIKNLSTNFIYLREGRIIMKKALSLTVSVLLILLTAATCFGGISALAATKQWEPRENPQDTLSYVNGEQSFDITTEADSKSGGIKITYNGKGTLSKWEFPLMQKDKDYKIVSQSGNTIIIKLTNNDKSLPYINAIVSFKEITTEQSTAQRITSTTKADTASSEPAKELTTQGATQETDSSASTALTDSSKNVDKGSNKILMPTVITGAVCAAVVFAIMIVKRKK